MSWRLMKYGEVWRMMKYEQSLILLSQVTSIVVITEDWKVEKYLDLAFEVKRIHHVEIAILPVVIGALGTVPKRLIGSVELIGIGDIIASTQMTALLGTAGILCRAMNL